MTNQEYYMKLERSGLLNSHLNIYVYKTLRKRGLEPKGFNELP